jgi:hypothetical protein
MILTVEQRLTRVEAQLAIQQLPSRYAVALDSRNMDAMARGPGRSVYQGLVAE